MTAADTDPRLQAARRAVANLRGERPRPRLSRSEWLALGLLVVTSVLVLSALTSAGISVYRLLNPTAPRPLYVCVQVAQDGNVATQTGAEPCWAAPSA